MKNFKSTAILFFPSLFFACQPSSVSNPKPAISISKQEVKIGEPVYASSTGQKSNSYILWSASANGKTWASETTDSVTALFTSSGTYQLSATYFSGNNQPAYDSNYVSITVTDSIYSDTSTLHCDVVQVKNILPGETVTLAPVSYSDTGLVFVAHTSNAYPHSPILNCGGNIYPDNGTYTCDIQSALIIPCFGSANPSPAVGIVSLSALTQGTHILKFNLNGVSFSGTLIVTDSQCTITWPFQSGITVSPLIIVKN